ncbi:malto-oligosyltrehalose synthase [Pontibacter silvestris]|uniref:Malto-oligosyltrehalose synthase n=1 Tax=Pontibacter silvestris TaxID=2305183 RepID=A0ABW4WWJ2_9BACT|nr:malto-oligosyltrehalose synthase [Pontibacter silvestris]MCC9138378.1 malto-oligosyltrehalose synthase [Pontibacter silvestris]
MVHIPNVTYRLQLSAKFKLKQVQELIPYLKELGVSTIYASPFFTARAGSEHGYDVTDPLQINPEIGTLEEFRQIAKTLQENNMSWLQDIVPNHMAFDASNVWLMDVLEKGAQSFYYTFFDIDFKNPEFEGQVMVPFLGEPLENVLEQNQLKVSFGEKGFIISYFDNVYPASLESYPYLISRLKQNTDVEDERAGLVEQLHKIEQFSKVEKVDVQEWESLKVSLYQHFSQQQALQDKLKQLLEEISNSTEKMQRLLAMQQYKLSYWKDSMQRINYRRFFTVNDLICLRMERPEVFEHYHRFIKQLCDEKLVQGLRVDHVDGLFDPDQYLERLREMAGEDMYLVVEKILEGEENMPVYWPIQGNSGYDFLAWVSNLYTFPTGKERLSTVYKRLVPNATVEYEEMVFEKKLFMLRTRMNGELQNLLRVLQQRQLIPSDDKRDKWQQALEMLLVTFPIYRIYGNKFPLSQEALEVIDTAFKQAAEKAPDAKEQLRYLRSLFEVSADESEEQVNNKLYFVMRCQQFTGPLAAKGVEDTTFYNYSRLISLNEVGNSPDIFHLKPEQFHERMKYKVEAAPYSINATATHDTKRGEDARMRLNVLSELSNDWDNMAYRWLEKSRLLVPDTSPNDVYFLLQTLIGVMPHNMAIDDSLVQRVQDYMQKALREAKRKTNWADPNIEYEQKIQKLAKKLLQQDEEFIAEFKPFFKKLAYYGSIYSLCQTLLKLTCPGVPDIYQGTEFWDLSLVDPDNRRPVNYDQRQQYLQELRQAEQESVPQLHKQLLSQTQNARIKLYLMYKTLSVRNSLQDLFSYGSYIPLTVKGKYKEHVVAFARNYQQQWCIVAVPRMLVNLCQNETLPLGKDTWKDTAIVLPDNAPQTWKIAFSKDGAVKQDKAIPLATIMDTFPVALLTATAQ